MKSTERSGMKYLIVQTDRDYFTKSGEFKDGEPEFWFMTRRNRSRVGVGDVVYFWGSGGDEAAMYGWSVVTDVKDEPRDHPRAGKDTFEIDFARLHAWRAPLLKVDMLSQDDSLANMTIVRAPQGSLFVLKDDEVRALNEIIRRRDLAAPDDAAPTLTPASDDADSDLAKQLPRLSGPVGQILRRAGDFAESDGIVQVSHFWRAFIMAGDQAPRMTSPWFLWQHVEPLWTRLQREFAGSMLLESANTANARSNVVRP